MTKGEELLPAAIRSKAKVSPGGEYAWRRENLVEAVLAAKQTSLASLGGQAQFIFPDATCEMYWVNFDSEDQLHGESWNAYVERSANEVLKMFHSVRAKTDFAKEANDWEFIREKIQKEWINPLDYLWFVSYFGAESAS